MTAPIAALASSLAALCREHGIETPNRFTVQEIADGAGLSPRLAGRYIKHYSLAIRDCLISDLAGPVTLKRETAADRRRYVVVSRAAA